jgi:hypothetical protein
MHQDDLIEMEVSDFYKSVLLAVANGFQAPWENCYVCDPKNYDELSIISVEQNTITFRSLSGIPRQVPINVLSQWTALVPSSHILKNPQNRPYDNYENKRKLILELRNLGLPVNFDLARSELNLIFKCYSRELQETDRELRYECYSVIKKQENFPNYIRDSYIIGRRILEKWGQSSIKYLPPDVLIHLAYYRRWTKATLAALEVTACLEGPNFNTSLSNRERSILATERAAAYLDLCEENGSGLDSALRFLKYSHAANGGVSTAENLMCWKRYDRLKG